MVLAKPKRKSIKSVNQIIQPKSPSKHLKCQPMPKRPAMTIGIMEDILNLAGNGGKKNSSLPIVILGSLWLAIMTNQILVTNLSRLLFRNLLYLQLQILKTVIIITLLKLQLTVQILEDYPCVPSPYLLISILKSCGMICICPTRTTLLSSGI